MVNAGRVAAIAKMLLKPFASVAQFLMHAASTHSPFKSLMESGVVYLKMIALQFLIASVQLRCRLRAKYLLSPESKKPAGDPAGFL
jgi:hypothetical protein